MAVTFVVGVFYFIAKILQSHDLTHHQNGMKIEGSI